VARAADQQLLFEYLASLERNQKELAVALSTSPNVSSLDNPSRISRIDAQQSNMVAMMASLQKTILQKLGNETERRFYGQSLRFLSTISGHQVHLEDWMITSFEVDFGLEIGSGGL
jgi:hypothetical protein